MREILEIFREGGDLEDYLAPIAFLFIAVVIYIVGVYFI